jgi:hypothetical protein
MVADLDGSRCPLAFSSGDDLRTRSRAAAGAYRSGRGVETKAKAGEDVADDHPKQWAAKSRACGKQGGHSLAAAKPYKKDFSARL